MIPKDTKTVAGTVRSVTCGNDQEWSLVITHDGQPLTFHRKGPFEAGFSESGMAATISACAITWKEFGR
ncbi:MAG: hypothetical protein DMG77_05445 [Acidobacteria bacterium]|nr:MAG: hypothetical protein DMG77_05445 [Acidobacteriota bacterium]